MKLDIEDAPVIIYLRRLVKLTKHSKKRAKHIKELNEILKWAI